MELEIIIDIVKSLPGILIAAAVAYFFSQRRYTFEKLHDKKLLYIEEIFCRVVSLEKDLRKYVMTTRSMTYTSYLEDRKKELKPIQDKFFELQEYFWKKEIILDQSSIDSIQSFIDTSIQILSKLQASNVSTVLGDGKTSYEQWDDAYNTMQNKLVETKKELKRNFREVIVK